MGTLTTGEHVANKRLAEIIARYREKLSSQHTHASVFSHFDSETTSPGRMCQAVNSFEDTERELNGLFKEWMKTQQKIACLGVEVLGIEQFELQGSKVSGISKKRFNTAASMFKEHEKTEERAQDMKRRQGDEVTGATRELITRSKVQDKVSAKSHSVSCRCSLASCTILYRDITNSGLDARC